MFKFPLYVAGTRRTARRGLPNLARSTRYTRRSGTRSKVVHVCREPKSALADGILMTPTFVKLTPSLPGSIVGTPGRTQLVWPAQKLEILAA